MPTSRELALSGALLRSVMLIRRGWMDSAILARLDRDYHGGTRQQYLEIIALAHEGVQASGRIDWLDPYYKISLANPPQLPQE